MKVITKQSFAPNMYHFSQDGWYTWNSLGICPQTVWFEDSAVQSKETFQEIK